MATSHDAIVVGAGITGASAAYFLKKKGAARVLLIEKGPGPACSNTGRSAAIVRTFYTTALMTRLAKAAVELFAGLEDELGHDGGFRRTGFVQIVPPDWVATSERLVAMHQEAGIGTRFVAPERYGELFPWLNPEGVGAVVLEAESGYADAVGTTQAFADAFVRLGGEMRLGTACRGFTREGDRATGVLLEDGPLRAGAVVNATGPWSGRLARTIDLDLPMRALREQDAILELPPGRSMPTTPISNAMEPTYMRPLDGGRWLLGRGFPKPYFDVDPYNFKQSLDEDFAAEVLGLMTTRVPGLAGARVVGGYAALYDVTPDWMPYVGPRAGLEGYYDASGGSGHAFKTGPILARELADWILDGTVAEDFRRLSYDRVTQDNQFPVTFGGNRG